MHLSIYQEFIACKLQEDMRAASQRRRADEVSRPPSRPERIARHHRFVRRPTPTVSRH